MSLREIAQLKSVDVFECVRQAQSAIAELARRDVSPRAGDEAAKEPETWLDRLEATFLQAVLVYGYPALGLTLILGAFGLPVPTGLATSIAGAVARSGGLDWLVASVLVVAASVLGDLLAYALGRAIEPGVVLRHGRWLGYTPANRDRIELAFTRWGPATILVTRTFASHLSSVASLLAGFHRYAVGPFLVYSALGRVAWTAVYFGLGYLVGSNLEAATSFLENLGLTIVSGIVAAGAAYRPQERSFRAENLLLLIGVKASGLLLAAACAAHGIAGMTSTVSRVEEARPNSSEIASPWKIGSVRITAAPIIAASAVSRIGLKRIGAGLEQDFAQAACRPRARGG